MGKSKSLLTLKFKFDFDFGLTHSIDLSDGDRPTGVFVKFNKYRFELRKKHSYETIGKNSKGEVYHEGESDHSWEDKRGGVYADFFKNLPRGFCIDGVRSQKSYAEITEYAEGLSMDWLIDEFDSSFNSLASSVLVYHMDYAVTSCSDQSRALYTDILNRLNETVDFTEEEKAHLESCRLKSEDPLNMRCDVCKKAYDDYNDRNESLEERLMTARRDFIDISQEFWS